jgi:hypothetical protein
MLGSVASHPMKGWRERQSLHRDVGAHCRELERIGCMWSSWSKVSSFSGLLLALPVAEIGTVVWDMLLLPDPLKG